MHGPETLRWINEYQGVHERAREASPEEIRADLPRLQDLGYYEPGKRIVLCLAYLENLLERLAAAAISDLGEGGGDMGCSRSCAPTAPS
jgi:hypothetical protein